MKVKVLGTVSPFVNFDRNGPGFLVEDGEHKILLDCGCGVTRLLVLPYHLENLHIFISHFHRDHYNGIFNIQYASHIFHNQGKLEHPVEIHLPMLPAIKYDDVVEEEYSFANYHKIIEEFTGVEVGGMTVSFLHTEHTNESYAIKICKGEATIVYTSDISFEAKDKVARFAKDADLLICESSLLEDYGMEKTKSHLTARQAAIIAKEANVRQLMLTHFWPLELEGNYLKEAKQVFDNVICAREGMSINLE